MTGATNTLDAAIAGRVEPVSIAPEVAPESPTTPAAPTSGAAATVVIPMTTAETAPTPKPTNKSVVVQVDSTGVRVYCTSSACAVEANSTSAIVAMIFFIVFSI